jgi:hypothetical protein
MVNLSQPGNKASHSGLFRVIHAQQHAPEHYVTVLYGETFRPCKECLNKVRFEGAISAVHVNAHPFSRVIASILEVVSSNYGHARPQ